MENLVDIQRLNNDLVMVTLENDHVTLLRFNDPKDKGIITVNQKQVNINQFIYQITSQLNTKIPIQVQLHPLNHRYGLSVSAEFCYPEQPIV